MANYELVRKALAAKSPEELLKVAKDNKIGDINERNVKAYFDALSTWGELNDDELEMAVGAASFNSDGNRIVALGNLCSNREPYGGPWRCNKCGMPAYACNCYPDPNTRAKGKKRFRTYY